MLGPEVLHQNLEASGHETILDDRLDPLPIPHRLAHSRYGSSLDRCPALQSIGQLRQAFVETLVSDGHGVDWAYVSMLGDPVGNGQVLANMDQLNQSCPNSSPPLAHFR